MLGGMLGGIVSHLNIDNIQGFKPANHFAKQPSCNYGKPSLCLGLKRGRTVDFLCPLPLLAFPNLALVPTEGAPQVVNIQREPTHNKKGKRARVWSGVSRENPRQPDAATAIACPCGGGRGVDWTFLNYWPISWSDMSPNARNSTFCVPCQAQRVYQPHHDR